MRIAQILSENLFEDEEDSLILSYDYESEKKSNSLPILDIYKNEPFLKFDQVGIKYQLTEKQIMVFQNIFNQINRLEAEKITIPVSQIKFTMSIENEICIYRKTISGTSMIAIDEDGDILCSLISKNHDRKFYDFDNYDAESLIYNLLRI